MADWAQPVLTSLYTDVLDLLKSRDRDAATLIGPGGTALVNLPENTIHFQRATWIFHEMIAGVWQPRQIGVGGGGTGAADAANARTNLGLGTMATQNANNVAITGGSIAGVAAFSVAGNITAANIIATVALYGAGYNVTGLQANQVIYGVLPASVIPDPLPVRNAGNLTNLNAAQVANWGGIVPATSLGTGTPSAATFLRGDGIWAPPPSAGGFPSGLIVISTGACPPGWTRVAWDGAFLMVNNFHSGNSWGNPTTHAHGAGSYADSAHTHGAGSLAGGSHNHGGSTGTVSISVSGTTGSGGGHSHPFYETYSGTTGGESNGQMNCDAGSSGSMSRASHTHSFSGSVSGTTDAVGGHTHSFSGSGSGSGSISNSAPAVTGTTASGGGGTITGSSAAAAHMPPYIDVFLCAKD